MEATDDELTNGIIRAYATEREIVAQAMNESDGRTVCGCSYCRPTTKADGSERNRRPSLLITDEQWETAYAKTGAKIAGPLAPGPFDGCFGADTRELIAAEKAQRALIAAEDARGGANIGCATAGQCGQGKRAVASDIIGILMDAPELVAEIGEQIRSRPTFHFLTKLAAGRATQADIPRVAPTEIRATPEMIAAVRGRGLFAGHTDDVIAQAYRIMAALAPSTTLTVAPDARLVEERDNAISTIRFLREERSRLSGASAAFNGQCDRLIDDNSALGATNERLRDEIAALTAEKNALHDRVADLLFKKVDLPASVHPTPASGTGPARPVPLGNKPHASDCAVHNEPASRNGPCDCGALHNPFREFPVERRRIGG